MSCFQRTSKSFRGLAIVASIAVARLYGGDANVETTIELVSGERLVGHVVQENTETVRFESVTLGEVVIPRAKIHPSTTPATTAGGLTPAPTVTANAPTATPPVTKATPTPTKSDMRRWLHFSDQMTATVAAGASVKSGVLDLRSYTASFTFGYTTAANVFNSVFQYEYSKAGALVAADDFYFDNLWQHNLGAKTFVLVGGRYREDQVLAIDHELNVFVAPGLYLAKSAAFEFGVAGGLSELWQDYGSLTGGAGTRVRDLGAAAYQFLQWRLGSRVQLAQNTLFNQSLEDSGKYLYRLIISANLGLTEHLSLVNMYGYGYDSRPAAGVGHTQSSISTQLSYQF